MNYVISLSGGMDSATLAYKLKAEGHVLKAVSFFYGQRHSKELECAKKIAKNLEIDHQIIDISFMQELLPGNALTDSEVDVPEGHYEEENMKQTVVPNRNVIFLNLLAAHALALGYDGVALGIHSGDHAIYPDCREGVIAMAAQVVREANWSAENFHVAMPYVNDSKIQIIGEGKNLGVPYEDTWTCYKGKEKACGKCGSCQERLEAFEVNNIKDPVNYA